MKSPTLRNLHYFTVLAEVLHFGRAAERIGIAQPALSQQIRKLESEIGAELFRRDRREVRLTRAGEAFRPHAARALAEVTGGAEAARLTAAGEVGHLTIGFIESAAATIIPHAVGRFRAERRDVGLTLRELGVSTQLEQLHAGQLDVAVVRPPIDGRNLLLEEIAIETLLAAVPSGHPLAGRDRVRPEALADHPLVVLSRQVVPGLYDQILRIQQEAGGSGRIGQEATSIQAVLGLVAAGLGVAILPESVRSLSREGISFVPLQTPQRSTMIGAFREDDDNPLLRAFLDAAKEAQQAASAARGDETAVGWLK